MAVVPGVVTVPCLVTSLAYYAHVIGIEPRFFWGVQRGAIGYPVTVYYTPTMRRRLQSGLDAARRLVESQILVRLCPAWEAAEEHEYDGHNPIKVNWKHFLLAGVRGFSVYNANAAVVYGAVNATITIPHGGVGNASEVRVYWADGYYFQGPEPLSIVFGATNMVITIPRYRLVDPTILDAAYPVQWTDPTQFVTELAIAREYNDSSEQGRVRDTGDCILTCDESCVYACVVPRNRKLGWVKLFPASYSAGSWTRAACWLRRPDLAWVSYLAGLSSLPAGFEDACFRLAHTLMAETPCAGESASHQMYWSRDRKADSAITRERVNCPWGTMDGAWFAWNFFTQSPYNYGLGGGIM